MRAAVLRAPNAPFEIVDDLEVEDPGPGQVRVTVRHCGVCHSDLSALDGGFPVPLPAVLGHEAAGHVEAVGPGVTRLAAGDPVILTACPPCGHCYWCQRAQPTLCVKAAGLATGAFEDGRTGLSLRGERIHRGLGVGAFAEHVLVEELAAVPVPAEVPLDVACVMGCAVQTGVGAVLNTARVEEGATVLVLGLGGIGLSVVQGARAAGAGRILVSDPVAARRDVAKTLGATDLLDPTSEDVAARTHELTGVGADYAFEAAGRAALVETALAATRAGGTVVCVGAPPITESFTIAPAVIFAAQEKRLLGCLLGSCHALRDIPRLLTLWQRGHLDLEALITGRRPLAELGEAMADLAASRGVRTVIDLGA
jgi:Zn-dependent alcohol dehydrogenase